MSVATTDYLAAIAHLPAGAVLRIDDVSWEEYENLLADLGEGYAVRIFYDNGRMEVLAPASTHEKPKGIIHRLITTISDELDIVVESLGSTTLKKEMKARGAEPDDCFYIQNAALVIGKDDLNLEHDPAPGPGRGNRSHQLFVEQVLNLRCARSNRDLAGGRATC